MESILLSKIFDIISTKQKDKMHFSISDKNDKDAVPFLGRSAVNNGIVDYVLPIDSALNTGGVITIALDGSTGSTFYQHHDFCSGQNIWILKPKNEYFSEFTHIIALYLITSIRKAVQSYSYNLSLTKTRLMKISILLPMKNNQVDIMKITREMNKVRNIELVSKIPNKRLVQ